MLHLQVAQVKSVLCCIPILYCTLNVLVYCSASYMGCNLNTDHVDTTVMRLCAFKSQLMIYSLCVSLGMLPMQLLFRPLNETLI